MGVYALFFGLGAVSLATQSMMAREVLLLMRGSELAFGAFFASWLFWIGAGALVGTRVAPRLGDPARSLRWSVRLGALAPALQVVLIRHGQRLLGAEPGSALTFAQGALLGWAALAPFALMIGFTFPLGCRLLTDGSSRGIGRLYLAEALGSLAGGVLFAMALVGRVGHLPIALGGAALLVASCAWIGSAGDSRRGRVASVLAGVALLAAAMASTGLDEALRRAQVRALAPVDEVVAVIDTAYEQAALTRLGEQLTLYGDGQPEATFPDPYETPAEAYRLLAQMPPGCRVLVLGNATTGLAQELVRALDGRAGRPCAQVVVVQPDERIVRAIVPYLPKADAELLAARVQLVFEDPRSYLRRTQEGFDLLFLDVRDPTTVYLNRLFTAELFAQARRALAPGGVLAFRLTSAATDVGTDIASLAQSIHAALREVFPEVLVTSGEASWYFASAHSGSVTASPEAVAERLRAFAGAERFRAAIALEYAPERVRSLAERIARGTGIETNRDDRPSSYFYGTVLWERFAGTERLEPSRLRWALDRLREPEARWGLAPLALALLAWIAWGRRFARRERIDAALSVMAAGAAAMALNIVLLLRYQSACGALYERLALMSAFFMLGVALGAGAASRVAPRLAQPARLELLVFAALAAFAWALGPLSSALAALAGAARELSFAALFAAAGTGLGASFPASAQVLLVASEAGDGPRHPATQAGGLMDAMDHLGAMLGALGTGTFLLPALGTATTLHAIALVAGAVACLWLVRALWK